MLNLVIASQWDGELFSELKVFNPTNMRSQVLGPNLLQNFCRHLSEITNFGVISSVWIRLPPSLWLQVGFMDAK